mmetsp:Transcript_24155/g.63028  ORF Transcript_24155/g.63028 Transcript_24155/m.63028 type:complete len:223 (+) Transcript_24155:147-815(+)
MGTPPYTLSSYNCCCSCFGGYRCPCCSCSCSRKACMWSAFSSDVWGPCSRPSTSSEASPASTGAGGGGEACSSAATSGQKTGPRPSRLPGSATSSAADADEAVPESSAGAVLASDGGACSAAAPRSLVAASPPSGCSLCFAGSPRYCGLVTLRLWMPMARMRPTRSSSSSISAFVVSAMPLRISATRANSSSHWVSSWNACCSFSSHCVASYFPRSKPRQTM